MAKKTAVPIEIEVNPFCSTGALRALATQATERGKEIAAAVHPNNFFVQSLNDLAERLEAYAALMDERGHDGIPEVLE